MTRRRLIAALAAALVGLPIAAVLGAAVVLVLFDVAIDMARWRDAITARATASLGRPVALEGALELVLGRETRLRVGGVRILNPPGFAAQEFAALGDARARVDLFAALRGELHVLSFEAADGRVRLERAADGRTNWAAREVAAAARAEPALPQPAIEIDRIALNRLSVEYVDARSDTRHVLALDEVRASGRWDEPLKLQVRGRVDDTFRYTAEVAGGSARLLQESGEPWPFTLDFEFLGTRLHADGTVDAAKREARFDFGAGTEDLAQVERFLQTKLPKFGVAALTGKVLASAAAVELKALHGVLGDSELHGDLALTLGGARQRLTGALTVATLDLRPFLDGDPRKRDEPLGYDELARHTLPLRDLAPLDVDLDLRVGALDRSPGRRARRSARAARRRTRRARADRRDVRRRAADRAPRPRHRGRHADVRARAGRAGFGARRPRARADRRDRHRRDARALRPAARRPRRDARRPGERPRAGPRCGGLAVELRQLRRRARGRIHAGCPRRRRAPRRAPARHGARHAARRARDARAPRRQAARHAARARCAGRNRPHRRGRQGADRGHARSPRSDARHRPRVPARRAALGQSRALAGRCAGVEPAALAARPRARRERRVAPRRDDAEARAQRPDHRRASHRDRRQAGHRRSGAQHADRPARTGNAARQAVRPCGREDRRPDPALRDRPRGRRPRTRTAAGGARPRRARRRRFRRAHPRRAPAAVAVRGDLRRRPVRGALRARPAQRRARSLAGDVHRADRRGSAAAPASASPRTSTGTPMRCRSRSPDGAAA